MTILMYDLNRHASVPHSHDIIASYFHESSTHILRETQHAHMTSMCNFSQTIHAPNYTSTVPGKLSDLERVVTAYR